eukprot:TRINITY_DN67137_c9_g1_i5.p2 TRINITY_DN67137_c9_g1~~TRINITY_DN67137_c9_g1_i5.p2  ORF type:complete len:144 (-),score=5.80 TRINITY_DN67137_c9_g1_i5:597-1028(-)
MEAKKWTSSFRTPRLQVVPNCTYHGSRCFKTSVQLIPELSLLLTPKQGHTDSTTCSLEWGSRCESNPLVITITGDDGSAESGVLSNKFRALSNGKPSMEEVAASLDLAPFNIETFFGCVHPCYGVHCGVPPWARLHCSGLGLA